MRSSSSPPSPTAPAAFPRRLSHDDHLAPKSNLEDSVRSLSLSVRRRLVKRRSGGGGFPPKMESVGPFHGKEGVPRLGFHNGELLMRLVVRIQLEDAPSSCPWHVAHVHPL